MKSCATCQYYDSGGCRRYPPISVGYEDVAQTLSLIDTVFPQVNINDWCGEYRQSANIKPIRDLNAMETKQ